MMHGTMKLKCKFFYVSGEDYLCSVLAKTEVDQQCFLILSSIKFNEIPLEFFELYKLTVRQMKISVCWEKQQPITAFILNLKLCSRFAKNFL